MRRNRAKSASFAKRWVSPSAAAIGVLLLLTACSDSSPIDLGFIGGLSGRVADLGIAGRNGAILAVEEINAQGGVDGRPINLIVRDDEQTAAVAKKGVEELIGLKVEAIIGHMTSSMSVTTVPLVSKAKIPMISPTTTTDSLAGIDDYFFRVLAPTKVYATKNALYQYEQLGKRKIAAVYDVRNKAYTHAWFSNFRDAFEAQGGKIVGEVTFSSSPNVHFIELAQQLLKSSPDGILVVTSALDAALICQQIKKLDPEMHISTSEWAATEKLIELGGAAVEGILIAQFFERDSTDPDYLEFQNSYQERFNQNPGFASVAGYDAVYLFAKAMGKSKRGQSLRDSLRLVARFNGAQGEVKMDSMGDASRKSFLTTVSDAKFVVIEGR